MTKRTTSELCSRYNWATNPRAFNSDHESHRKQQIARACRRLLDSQQLQYQESDFSGRLYAGA